MNNSAFRDLLGAKPSSSSAQNNSFKTPALGSRARSSIPMTPRALGANHNASKEFARQVAEHNDSERPAKRFKSTAAPKGTRLGKGYRDRTLLRDGEEQDDREKRFKALEEMYKLQQIDQGTFEELKNQIGIGGDVTSTHLVKGLDFKLLERVRRGEDINSVPEKEDAEDADGEARADELEDELERALDRDVVAREKQSKDTTETDAVGDVQSPAQTMSRDEILRRLKESRSAQFTAAMPPPPVLGDRFKKLDKSGKKKFTETINGRRREVLVITDKNGKTKRKTRWIDAEDSSKPEQQPMGMEVPAAIAARQKLLEEQQAAAEEDDDDIFAGAGDYDPLADINSDSEASGGDLVKKTSVSVPEATKSSRNYFRTPSSSTATDKTTNVAQDPTILAALKRAAQLRQSEVSGGDEAEAAIPTDVAQTAKHRRFLDELQAREREDARDLDMGFGDSRFGDDEDDEEDRPVWDGKDENETDKPSGRKRGSKQHQPQQKRKNKVQDVMSVLEGRPKK